MAKTTVSTRKIYDRMVNPVMISRFDNYFRMISDKHPERVMRLYESNQYVNIGFTQKAMHMFNNTELSAALLVRLSLIFSLTYGVDKESIRPYTHLVKESVYKYQMQVPRFWLRTRLVRDLGETWEWLMALMSFSANRFADMYSAFNMKDAITYDKKDFDPSGILEMRPNTNMTYAYELLLIEYMLNKTALKNNVVFRPENNTIHKLKECLKEYEDLNTPQAVRLVERLIENKISWVEINRLAKLWDVQH